MASRVVMPKLTDTMEEGTLVAWKKREGERVEAGEVIAEIETDKAVMDLEAFASGIVRKIVVPEGETVPSGTLLAVVAEADEDITAALTEQMAPAPSPSPVTPPAPGVAAATAAPPSSASSAPRPSMTSRETEARPPASPRARALAAERGVDLSAIVGTGPGGRIVEEDVLRAAPTAAPASASVAEALPSGTDQPLSQMRKAIARTMVQSKAPVPHFYVTTEIGMDEAEQLREQLNREGPFRPTATDLIIKATALALERHPAINVSYVGDAIRRYATIDIGVAVGMEDGLITPVIRDCGAKSLETITVESRSLIERARLKRLQPVEYTGATFSISNLGMFDVENFIAVLVPPQAASLAVGAIRTVPVVVDGAMRIGQRMKVTLSCDHRALDGLVAAQFLKELKRILEHPQELVSPSSTG
ncbi:MAG: 2-oxo acid dehydrogenase subunit E2 [Nitrospira sp.]|nr:2-oxo acid dehydrogenase subunit E2 [Nitrospira sp.]